MSKLQELRNLVADVFKEATDKTTIEKSVTISNKIKEIEEEQDALTKKHAELLGAYKEAVINSSFKSEPINAGATTSMPTDEEFLADWLNTHKTDGSAK